MSKIEIKKISITDIKADCVVNAANEGLWEGGGVCGTIFKAAGSKELTKACQKIGYCDTGDAVITPAFKMKANYIIHAVGPRWTDGKHGEPMQLYDAYKHSLELAQKNGCHSIAFPLISAGIFGYPMKLAWRKGIRASVNFMKKNPDYDMNITFAILDDHIISTGKAILTDILAEDPTAIAVVKKEIKAAHDLKKKTQSKFSSKSNDDLIQVFQHTLKMCEEDDVLIENTRKMQNGSVLYFEDYQAPYHETKGSIDNIEVVEDTTFSCAGKHIDEGKVAVLNFANAIHPGGGVKKGSKAQEEGLCRSSNLYLGLDLPYFKKYYYDANKEKGQSIGTDALIYHPDVTVFKDDKLIPDVLPKDRWFQVDVLTCAAPRMYQGNELSAEKQEEIHVKRGRNILEVAIANQVDIIVLGAFGCGAFHNSPAVVAEAMRKLLMDEGYAYYFKKVIFAIKKDHNDTKGNYHIFKEILAPDVKIVKKTDWAACPMPEKCAHFLLKRHFTKEQLDILRQGHIPEEMEDKWFWYMEENTLFCHRSWTGYCIFVAEIDVENDLLHVTVNQDPEQYTNYDLQSCAETLDDLLNWWTMPEYDYYSEWLHETVKSLELQDSDKEE